MCINEGCANSHLGLAFGKIDGDFDLPFFRLNTALDQKQ